MTSPVPALDGSLGAIEIGLVLGTFLFGTLTLQTFNYFHASPKDYILLKGLVAFVWFLELAHTISAWHAMYLITVKFYGQPEHITNPPHSLVLMVLFSAVLTVAVQTFFAFRVRSLSKRWPITIVCCSLNILAFVINILPLPTLWAKGLDALEGKGRWVVALASALIPAANITIAISLCYYLWHVLRAQQGSGKFKQTRSMIVTLIIWTAETTILTSVMSIMQLILFLARRDLVWTTFFLLHAKLLSNCMLAALNGRHRFRSELILDTGVTNVDSEIPRNRSVTIVRMNRMADTFDDAGQEMKDFPGASGGRDVANEV